MNPYAYAWAFMNHLPDDASQRFAFTRPKIVFCDVGFLDILQKILKRINLNPKIFTFGGEADGTYPVEDLFIENSPESKFM